MSKKANIFTRPMMILVVAILCTLLWGSAFPCVKIGYQLFQIEGGDIPTKILFAGIRFLLAGVLVLIISIARNRKLVIPNKGEIGGVVTLGIVQTTIQYIFFYIGLANTSGVKASILNATGTFAALILAHFFYKNDKLNLQKSLGCLVGFTGVILINLDGTSLNSGFRLMGEGFVMLAQLSFAVGVLLTKRVTRNMDSIITTGYQLSIGGLVLLVIGIVCGGKLEVVSVNGVLMLVYLALLSSVAFTLWSQLLKNNPVGKITVYNFLVPIFGSILSAVFLKENIFSLNSVVAILCVSMGIYMANRQVGNREITKQE